VERADVFADSSAERLQRSRDDRTKESFYTQKNFMVNKHAFIIYFQSGFVKHGGCGRGVAQAAVKFSQPQQALVHCCEMLYDAVTFKRHWVSVLMGETI
jgi:hypothetical protein